MTEKDVRVSLLPPRSTAWAAASLTPPFLRLLKLISGKV
jgi:hypothetical protein